MRKLRLALAFAAAFAAMIVTAAPPAHADTEQSLIPTLPTTDAICLKCLIGGSGEGGGL